MTPEARKVWKTPAGASLLEAMFKGEPLQPQDRATLERIKKIDPPAKPQPNKPA